MANIIKRVWNQNRMVQIEDLRGMTFQAEAAGHTFQISGIDDDGNTVALTGTPSGVLLRPDNTDVALTCSVSGGVVSATLPANCYDVPGRFGLTIFITSGSSKTAIYAAVGTVTRTSSGTVAPGTSQSVVDLINAINAAVNSIPASYSALLADIAPTYSNSALYSVGQYAWYDGDLKRCIVPITTAESYTAAHWTSAVLGQDVSDLKSALKIIENEFIDTEEVTPTILQEVGYYSGTLASTSGWTDGNKYSVFQYELTVGKKYFLSEPYNYYAFSNSDYSSGMSITKIDVTENVLTFVAEKKYLYVYRTSPSHQTASNTYLESMDNAIDDIEKGMVDIVDNVNGHKSITKYGCVRQSLNSEGEPGSASTTRIFTSKIPITEVKAIDGIAGYDFTIYAFGEDGVSLGYYYNGTFSKTSITWVEGANTLYISNIGIKSFRVYVKEHTSATITIDEIAGISLESDNDGRYNWFKGKKWYAIGDSITYGTYSKSDGTIARNPAISYPNVCSGLIDYELVNLGVPNLGFTVNATDSSFTDQTLPDVLTNHNFQGAELVTVALGTNDYGRNGTLGTIGDNSSVNSIYGRIKLIVETLMTKCPKARIIFFTPIPREKVGSAESQYDKTVQNASGFTFNAVKNAIIEACEYYAIEYINMTDTFALNYANHTTFQKDNLHPTIEGHTLMAKCLASKIIF